MNNGEFVEFLKDLLSQRRKRNSRYSLRAFAQSLGIHSATLSLVLSGKRRLTPKHIVSIVERLGLADQEIGQRFIKASIGLAKVAPPPKYTVISGARFSPVRDWEHTAILAAFEINPRLEEATLALRLGVPRERVKHCVQALAKGGLLKKTSAGWISTEIHQLAVSEVPSEDLRECHRQFMLQAMRSLELDERETREISGMTMTVSAERLALAKKAISDFQTRLVQLMGDGKQDGVYRLNVQFFPLLKGQIK